MGLTIDGTKLLICKIVVSLFCCSVVLWDNDTVESVNLKESFRAISSARL